MSKKTDPRAFRLRFGHTAKRKWASTLKQAVADARYWTSFGQKRVCIDRKLPSGDFKQVRCVVRQ